MERETLIFPLGYSLRLHGAVCFRDEDLPKLRIFAFSFSYFQAQNACLYDKEKAVTLSRQILYFGAGDGNPRLLRAYPLKRHQSLFTLPGKALVPRGSLFDSLSK